MLIPRHEMSNRMNKIREIRRGLDMTQQQLADFIGSDRGYISKLEKGELRNPSLGRARLIAMILNSSLDEVFPK